MVGFLAPSSVHQGWYDVKCWKPPGAVPRDSMRETCCGCVGPVLLSASWGCPVMLCELAQEN